jgi:hypothetical protein
MNESSFRSYESNRVFQNQRPSNRSFVRNRKRIDMLKHEAKDLYSSSVHVFLDSLSRNLNNKTGIHIQDVKFDRTIYKPDTFGFPYKTDNLKWNAFLKVSGTGSSSNSEIIYNHHIWNGYTQAQTYVEPSNITSLIAELNYRSATLKNLLGEIPDFVSPLENVTKKISDLSKFYINSSCAGSPMDFSFDNKKLKVFQAEFRAPADSFLHKSKCLVIVGPLYPTTSFGESDCHMNLTFGCVIRSVSCEIEAEDNFVNRLRARDMIDSLFAGTADKMSLASYSFRSVLECIFVPADLIAVHVDWGYPFMHRLQDKQHWVSEFQATSEVFQYNRSLVCHDASVLYDSINQLAKTALSHFLDRDFFESKNHKIKYLPMNTVTKYFPEVHAFKTRFLSHPKLIMAGADKTCRVMYNTYTMPFVFHSIRTNMRIQVLKMLCFSRIAQYLFSCLLSPPSEKDEENIGFELELQSDDEIDVILNQEELQNSEMTRKKIYDSKDSFKKAMEDFNKTETTTIHTSLLDFFGISYKDSAHAKLDRVNDAISAMLHIQYGLHPFGFSMSKFKTHEEESLTLQSLIRLYYICFQGTENSRITGEVYSKMYKTPLHLQNEIACVFNAIDEALNVTASINEGVHSDTKIKFSPQKNDTIHRFIQSVRSMHPIEAFLEGKISPEEVLSMEMLKPTVLMRAKVPMSLDTIRIHCNLGKLSELNLLAVQSLSKIYPCEAQFYPKYTDARTTITPIYSKEQLMALQGTNTVPIQCFIACDHDCDTRNIEFKVMKFHQGSPYQEEAFDRFHEPIKRIYYQHDMKRSNFVFQDMETFENTETDTQKRDNIFVSLTSVPKKIKTKYGLAPAITCPGENNGHVTNIVVGGGYVQLWQWDTISMPQCLLTIPKNIVTSGSKALEEIKQITTALYNASVKTDAFHRLSHHVQLSSEQESEKLKAQKDQVMWEKIQTFMKDFKENWFNFKYVVDESSKCIEYGSFNQHAWWILRMQGNGEIMIDNIRIPAGNELDYIAISLNHKYRRMTQKEFQDFARKYESTDLSITQSKGDYLIINGTKKVAIGDSKNKKLVKNFEDLVFGFDQMDQHTLFEIFQKYYDQSEVECTLKNPYEGVALFETLGKRRVCCWLEHFADRTVQNKRISKLYVSVEHLQQVQSKKHKNHKITYVFSNANLITLELLQQIFDHYQKETTPMDQNSTPFDASGATKLIFVKEQMAEEFSRASSNVSMRDGSGEGGGGGGQDARSDDERPSGSGEGAGSSRPAYDSTNATSKIPNSEISDKDVRFTQTELSELVSTVFANAGGTFVQQLPSTLISDSEKDIPTDRITHIIKFAGANCFDVSNMVEVFTYLIMQPVDGAIYVHSFVSFNYDTKKNCIFRLLPKLSAWEVPLKLERGHRDRSELVPTEIKNEIENIIRCLVTWNWGERSKTPVDQSWWENEVQKLIGAAKFKAKVNKMPTASVKNNEFTFEKYTLALLPSGQVELKNKGRPILTFKLLTDSRYDEVQYNSVLRTLLIDTLHFIGSEPAARCFGVPSMTLSTYNVKDIATRTFDQQAALPDNGASSVENVSKRLKSTSHLASDVIDYLQRHLENCTVVENQAGGITLWKREQVKNGFLNIPATQSVIFLAHDTYHIMGSLWPPTATKVDVGNTRQLADVINTKFKEAVSHSIPSMKAEDVPKLIHEAISTAIQKFDEEGGNIPMIKAEAELFKVPTSPYSIPSLNFTIKWVNNNVEWFVGTTKIGQIVFEDSRDISKIDALYCTMIQLLQHQQYVAILAMEQKLKLAQTSFIETVLTPMKAHLESSFSGSAFQIVTNEYGASLQGTDLYKSFSYYMASAGGDKIEVQGIDEIHLYETEQELGIVHWKTQLEDYNARLLLIASLQQAEAERKYPGIGTFDDNLQHIFDILVSRLATYGPSATGNERTQIDHLTIANFHIGFSHPLLKQIDHVVGRTNLLLQQGGQNNKYIYQTFATNDTNSNVESGVEVTDLSNQMKYGCFFLQRGDKIDKMVVFQNVPTVDFSVVVTDLPTYWVETFTPENISSIFVNVMNFFTTYLTNQETLSMEGLGMLHLSSKMLGPNDMLKKFNFAI